jgi:chemotaxis family two-component system sensor kinase Cph1
MLRRLRSAPNTSLADLVLQHAPMAVVVLRGEALRVSYLNPAAKSMARIERNVEGEPFESFFPEVWPQTLELLRRVIHDREPATITEAESWHVKAGGGGPSYLNVDCIPLDSRANGTVDSVVLLIQNVTEQVQLRREAELRARDAEAAHQALAKSDAQLRFAASSAPLVLYARDRDLRLNWVYNPRSEKDLTINLGRTVEEVVHPEDARVVTALYREVMRTGQPRRHLMRFHHSNLLDAPWQNVHIQPLRDEKGEIAGVICAAYDVTEMIEARAALAEREALLGLALEVGEMGAWSYHPTTGTVRHSASLASIYGLPSEEESRVGLLMGLVHPEDLARVHERMQQAVADESYLGLEHRIVRLDGEVRWVSVRARGRRSDDGEVCLIGITIDITDEHRLRERLEQSNRALEHFARTVAHDLKTPLQTMLGFGELLRRSAQEKLSEAEREKMGYLLESGRQMGELIDGILENARAAHAPVRQPVELEAALAQALERLRLAVREAGAEISHEPLPSVTGNPALLVQILQNLIANALKYRHRERPLRIHLSARRRERDWVITVRDNGIGIAPERQARLFEAFERGHGESDYGGLGLGLALVKDAVEHHGGTVGLESRPGEGSAFYFSLPAAESNITP